MKRLRILFIVLLAIILIVMCGNKVQSYPDDGESSLSGALWYGSKNKAHYYTLTAATAEQCNNLYCIEQGDELPNDHKYVDGWLYNIWHYSAKVTMSGDKVTFCHVDEWGNESGHYTRDRVEADYVLAAILCAGDDLGMWSSGSSYTSSQLALFEYWNTWVSDSGSGYFPSGGGSGSGSSSYETIAEGTAYNLTIKLFTPARGSGYQNLILVDRDGSDDRIPPTIDIPVTKVWNDGSNTHGNRPDNVTINLKLNGSNIESKTLSGTGNSWSETYYEKDDETGYSVSEPSVTGYNTSISGNATNGFVVTNTLKTTSITVNKTWNDEDNRDGKRTSVKITLKANGEKLTKDAFGNQITNPITLKSSNKWTYTFSNLPQYINKNKVTYTVEEKSVDGYKSEVTGNASDGYTITNTHIPERTQVTVTKVWNDMDDLDELRKPVTITLKADGTKLTTNADGEEINPIVLDESNNWTYTFTELYKYKHVGKLITYSVEEDSIYTEANARGEKPYNSPKYDSKTNDDGNIEITITNTHEPKYDGYYEISGTVWNDGAPGKGSNLNGTYGDEDSPLSGIKVRLKDQKGNLISSTYTNQNGGFTRTDYAETDANGRYTIRVNYDNSKDVYKLYKSAQEIKEILKTSYIEFEYDGMTYTTVKTATTGENTSKATENESTRNTFDSNHTKVTSATQHPNNWTDKYLTATTKAMNSYQTKTIKRAEVIKYCNGNGTYDRTQYDDSTKVVENKSHTCPNCSGKGHNLRTFEVEVITIPNMNLGLFEREQPDVAIFSDLSKVEVVMNGQKYTYLYGVRGAENNDVGLKAKFENKGTYTYRRPVNPADIAYVNAVDSNAMNVNVTYEVKVANLSTTVPITVHSIINSFDNEYTLNNAGWTVSQVSGFKQATNGNLNITVEPQKESPTIELTYTVSHNAIKGLLQEEATLNNAVEIGSYSTQYGTNTLYAEERTGGRNGKAYGGYDYDSHPGNAGIFINSQGKLEAAKPEDDTDIAPSFVLVKDPNGSKILAGTVWEDTDPTESTENNERLGNGYIDNTEKNIQNVKVELYNIDGTRANLYGYDENSKTVITRDAVVTTNNNGEYSLDDVVTGEYFIRFTYGDNKDIQTTYYKKAETGDAQQKTEKELQEITQINAENKVSVNARNYKSTTISDEKIKEIMNKNYNDSGFDKKWHINHTDNYSVAVDNMLDRLAIEDLKNSNYNIGENMTAYTKPFATLVEFETNGTSQVGQDGYISGVTNRLDKLDFGIIERPREALIVQKTITDFKLMLANGQLLAKGNPTDPNANINYTKLMGFNQNIRTVEAAAKAIEKRLLVEIDAELIQNAQLEVTYEVEVTNNNEIDYDYGNAENYGDIIANVALGECDKYIVKNSNKNANYYYYGNKGSLNEMKATIEFVDYINKELTYELDNNQWKYENPLKLLEDGYINTTVKDVIENKYQAYRTANSEITLERGDSLSQNMKAKKVLANQDNNAFDNNAEIIKIDGKTARTIKAKYEDGRQIEYIPGNYAPGVSENEVDDDRVDIIVTPPTGITNYITTYVIATLIGLIIVVIGVLFIKKKVLIK